MSIPPPALSGGRDVTLGSTGGGDRPDSSEAPVGMYESGREIFFLTTGRVSKDSELIAGGGGAGAVKLGECESATPIAESGMDVGGSLLFGKPTAPALWFSKLKRNPS